MSDLVRFIVVNEENVVATFSFEDAKECYVGRSADCDIQLRLMPNQQGVSRHHCVFHIDPPVVFLKVLATKNRTYVNDLPITSLLNDPLIELRDGDEVRIGPYTLAVQVITDDLTDMIHAAHAASEHNQ